MALNDLSRRTFVFGGGALLAGALLGAAAQPLSAQADVLRPPGALPEESFMARCIKCERCLSVCPTDVLKPLGIEAGLAQARTPTLDFAAGSCTFCDQCRLVCPTGAIGSVDPERPETGRIGGARLVHDRCVAYFEPGSCGVCKDGCPYDAISYDDERRPQVDDAKCNGCGECVRICPANVLTSFAGGKVRGIEVVTNARLATEGGAL